MGMISTRIFAALAAAKERAAIPLPSTKVKTYREAELDAAAKPPYVLLSTVRNEGPEVKRWLSSIEAQSHPPTEVVIVDGGSTDSTIEEMRAWFEAASSRAVGKIPFEIRFLGGNDLNIAEGRNMAREKTDAELLVLTDAGCRLDSNWAARLVAPFSIDPELEASFGFYDVDYPTDFEELLGHWLMPQLEQIDPQYFFPSGRSIALKATLWDSLGGYPEFLTKAGEDTLFDFYLKSQVEKAAFVPSARVTWKFPSGINECWKRVASYARGDAEAGLVGWNHYLFVLWWGVAVVFFAGLGLLLALPGFFAASTMMFVMTLVLLTIVLFRFRPDIVAEEYNQGLSDAVIGAFVMASAQSYGFIRGLESRKSVRRRQLALCKNRVVLLFSDEPLYPSGQSAPWVQRLLQARYFVVNVYTIDSRPHQRYCHKFYERYDEKTFDESEWLSLGGFSQDDISFFFDKKFLGKGKLLCNALTAQPLSPELSAG